MKPSLGRILHYHDADMDKVLAGIVSRVNDDGSFDLTVFYPSGGTSARFSLTERDVATDTNNSKPEQWFWPPRV